MNQQIQAPRKYDRFSREDDAFGGALKDYEDLTKVLVVRSERMYDDDSRTYHTFYAFDNHDQIEEYLRAHPEECLHELMMADRKRKYVIDIDASAEKVAAMEEAPEPAPFVRRNTAGQSEAFIEYINEVEQFEAKMHGENMKLYNCEWDGKRRLNIHMNVMTALRCALFKCGLQMLDSHVIVCDSSDKSKFSRHYILEFALANQFEAKAFTKLVMDMIPCDKFRAANIIDAGIHRANGSLRMAGCSKPRTTRKKVILSGHSVRQTFLMDCDITPRINLDGAVVAIDNTVNKNEVFIDIDMAEVARAAEKYITGHVLRKRAGNLLIYDRRKPTHCDLCNRIHNKDNTLMISIGTDGHIHIKCRKYCEEHGDNADPIKIRIESLKPVEAARDVAAEFNNEDYVNWVIPYDLEVPIEMNMEKIYAETLPAFGISDGEALLVESPMGTLKTVRTNELIKSIDENTAIVLVSFRQSFTLEMKTRLESFESYQDIQGEIKISEHKRLIIQFESMHRLKMSDCRVLLILDETESILNQIENPALVTRGTLEKCWNAFEWLLINSCSIIALDAMAGQRTYNLLMSVGKKVRMIRNTFRKEQAPADFYYDSTPKFFKVLEGHIPVAKEQPIAIVTNSKKMAKKIHEICTRMNPGAMIKIYTGESDGETRRDLLDVNKSWADVDILIYTSTISAGCSFELPRFTRMFAYFSSRSTDYRTCIQMLGRVRNLSTREYHIRLKQIVSYLPDDPEDIRKMLLDIEGVKKLRGAGINVAIADAPRYIAANGEDDFRHKDLYYYAHVYNISAKIESMNMFRRHFIALRKYAGAKCKGILDDVPEEDAKNITEDIKNTGMMIVMKESQRVAAAVVDCFTTEDEEKWLEKQPQDVRIKYLLIKRYKIAPEKMDACFVAGYDKEPVKRAWDNLQIFGRIPIRAAVDMWIERTSRIDNEIMKRRRYMVNTCINILNVIFTDQCDRVDNFGALISIPSEELEGKIENCNEYISSELETIMIVWELRCNNRYKDYESRDTQGKLKFINSLLSHTFDLNIKRSKDRKKYEAAPSALFVWNMYAKRYQLPHLYAAAPSPADAPEPSEMLSDLNMP